MTVGRLVGSSLDDEWITTVGWLDGSSEYERIKIGCSPGLTEENMTGDEGD